MTLPWAHTWRQHHLGQRCAICRLPIAGGASGIVELWLGSLRAPVHVECVVDRASLTPTYAEPPTVQS